MPAALALAAAMGSLARGVSGSQPAGGCIRSFQISTRCRPAMDPIPSVRPGLNRSTAALATSYSLLALRQPPRSPPHRRRLAPRLQPQTTAHRPRRPRPNRVRPNLDHHQPTPSRIATGPPTGAPQEGQSWPNRTRWRNGVRGMMDRPTILHRKLCSGQSLVEGCRESRVREFGTEPAYVIDADLASAAASEMKRENCNVHGLIQIAFIS